MILSFEVDHNILIIIRCLYAMSLDTIFFFDIPEKLAHIEVSWRAKSSALFIYVLFVLGGISPSLHEMYRFKFVK